MKTLNWKKQSVWRLILLLAVIISSCKDEKDYYDPNWERPHCDFTFDTEAATHLSVTYENLVVPTFVYFEIYDQMPVDEVNGVYVKKDEILPLYSAYTDNNGTFSTDLNLPTYLKDVYVYTPAFFAQTLIKTTCSGGQIIAKDGNMSEAKAFKALRAGSGKETYDCYPVKEGEWKKLLGEWDESTGKITGFTLGGTTYKTILVYLYDKKYPCDWYYSQCYYTDPEFGYSVKISEWYDKNGNINYRGDYYYRKVATNTSAEEHPGYAYVYSGEGFDLSISDKTASELYKAQSAVINVNKSCPQEYRASTDMLVGIDAEVAITLLGGNTCWNSSLGYYYYKDGETPSSLANANPIVIFPNTQDGQWSNNPSAAAACKGVERGTCVQLIYYPNIASGSKDGATKIFPKGTRIGFVLACNGWSHSISGFGGEKKYRAATSSGLSVDNNGDSYNVPRTAVYKYNEYVMISFEDYKTDENFSDVVITMKSNPINAITDIVEVTETEIITTDQKGIYAFEDIWPAEGDYDMNDVLVEARYEKVMPVETKFTINQQTGETMDIEIINSNKMSRESFTLQTYQNYAVYQDGLACILDLTNESAIESISYEIKEVGNSEFVAYTPTEALKKLDVYKKHGPLPYNDNGTKQYNIVYLDDNVKTKLKDGVGPEYKIVIKYKENSMPAITSMSDIHPYIKVTQIIDSYEIHIPLEAPTNDMISTLWSKRGTADASLPARILDKDGNVVGDTTADGRGAFYIRANNMNNYLYGPWYPFAIKLAGATANDLKALLNPDNETIPISKLYPNYENWVKSNGLDYTDWYKTTLQK